MTCLCRLRVRVYHLPCACRLDSTRRRGVAADLHEGVGGLHCAASTAWATLLLQLRAFALGFDASLPRRRRRRGRDGQCLMSVVVGVCLPVLATDQRYVQRVFVSDQNRAKGIYTLKFYKQGQVGGRCRWVACAFWWTG